MQKLKMKDENHSVYVVDVELHAWIYVGQFNTPYHGEFALDTKRATRLRDWLTQWLEEKKGEAQ